MNLQDRTTAALAWLDTQLALCNAATKGPWVGTITAVLTATKGEYIGCDMWHKDAAFIAAARTGYPAMLEGMKVAIEELQWQSSDNRIGDTGRIRAQQALDSILTKIESLQ